MFSAGFDTAISTSTGLCITVRASSAILGGMVAENELADKPVAPVLAHFSDSDATTPLDGIATLRERSGEEAVVYEYPAAHGFNCDQRGAYNQGAAEVAWQRSLAFLRMCLQ